MTLFYIKNKADDHFEAGQFDTFKNSDIDSSPHLLWLLFIDSILVVIISLKLSTNNKDGIQKSVSMSYFTM